MFLTQSPQQVTGAAGKATLNADSGVVTTEALATAAGATATYTVNCKEVTSKSVVLATVSNGTNNAGDPDLSRVQPADNGTITLSIINRGAGALNGTLKIALLVLN